MSEFDYVSSVDLEDWWDDLNIEQRRAAFEAWQKAEVKSVFTTMPKVTVYTKHIDLNEKPIVPQWEPPEQSDKEKEHDEIRKQLASKVVWDQDRFPRPMAWDEDQFTDKRDPMTEDELKEWLYKQSRA